MKRIFLIAFFLITATACASTQETPQPTFTSIPPTTTLASTPTREPSPTPTPEPYLLEDGVLKVWDEEAGDYAIVSEGIDALTTSAEGVILAVDGTGFPRFLLKENAWIEIMIPEGTENHEELIVQDRWKMVVENGEVKKVKESELKVLMDENGKFTYEWDEERQEWKVYEPRVFEIGSAITEKYSVLESGDIPVEIIESAVETVLNVSESELFTRDGEVVPLGYDREWGIEEWSSGGKHMWWFGVNLGVGEYNNPDDDYKGHFLYVATQSLSGDMYVVGMPQYTARYPNFDVSLITKSYAGDEVPETEFLGESVNITKGKLMESMATDEAIGKVVHVRTEIYVSRSNPTIDDWKRMWGDFVSLMKSDSEVQLSEYGYARMFLGTIAMKDGVWAELGY